MGSSKRSLKGALIQGVVFINLYDLSTTSKKHFVDLSYIFDDGLVNGLESQCKTTGLSTTGAILDDLNTSKCEIPTCMYGI